VQNCPIILAGGRAAHRLLLTTTPNPTPNPNPKAYNPSVFHAIVAGLIKPGDKIVEIKTSYHPKSLASKKQKKSKKAKPAFFAATRKKYPLYEDHQTIYRLEDGDITTLKEVKDVLGNGDDNFPVLLTFERNNNWAGVGVEDGGVINLFDNDYDNINVNGNGIGNGYDNDNDNEMELDPDFRAKTNKKKKKLKKKKPVIVDQLKSQCSDSGEVIELLSSSDEETEKSQAPATITINFDEDEDEDENENSKSHSNSNSSSNNNNNNNNTPNNNNLVLFEEPHPDPPELFLKESLIVVKNTSCTSAKPLAGIILSSNIQRSYDSYRCKPQRIYRIWLEGGWGVMFASEESIAHYDVFYKGRRNGSGNGLSHRDEVRLTPLVHLSDNILNWYSKICNEKGRNRGRVWIFTSFFFSKVSERSERAL